MVAAADGNCGIELGIGGSELVITNKSGKGTRVRSLGSREFIRYYRQKPRPSSTTARALALSMPSRYVNTGQSMKSSGFSFKKVVLLLTNKVQYLCFPLQI